MKNMIAGLVAVSGLAGLANAGASTFNFEASVDGGATWANVVNALPGSTVMCRVSISTGDTVYGLSGATYNVQGDGLQAGTSVDIASAGLGRQAGFNFGNGSQNVFYSGTKFKIDASSDPNFPGNTTAGINTAQNTPLALGSTFNQSNPAHVYMFKITLGAGQTNDVTFTTTADQVSRGSVLWYSSSTSSKGDNTNTVGSILGGTIHVPAPTSLALVGLGGLVAGRRRR